MGEATLPPLEEPGFSRVTVAFKEELVPPSYSERDGLQEPVERPSRCSLLHRPPSFRGYAPA